MRLFQLYRHYNQDGDLLYVGQSLNVLSRLIQHNGTSCWASQIAFIEIERFLTMPALCEAEGIAIASEQPLYNQTLPSLSQTQSLRPVRSRGRPRITEPRPWQIEGISRVTWYRRQKEKK